MVTNLICLSCPMSLEYDSILLSEMREEMKVPCQRGF